MLFVFCVGAEAELNQELGQEQRVMSLTGMIIRLAFERVCAGSERVNCAALLLARAIVDVYNLVLEKRKEKPFEGAAVYAILMHVARKHWNH